MRNQIANEACHLRGAMGRHTSGARYIDAMIDEGVEVNDGYGLTLQRGGVLDER